MKCIICGKTIERSAYSGADLCSSKCFYENFWNETIDETAIIVNGGCYHDGGRLPAGYSGFMGHGGKFFRIEMFDGRIIETNNLWYNGKIPVERAIKDNARFI